MKLKVDMNYKNEYTCDEEVIVEKTIFIDHYEFEGICKNLYRDNSNIADNLETMFYDNNNDIAHVLLMIDKETGHGLIVNSEGNCYVKEYSYLPNAKMLWDMDRYPILQEAYSRMVKVADEIVEKAVAENENNFFSINMCQYDEVGNIPIDRTIINEMLLSHPLVCETECFTDEICIALNPIEKKEELEGITQEQFDIMTAKHILWLYDQGGEQADFSNCSLKNINFRSGCLNNAIFNNSTLYNCNMREAEICFAEFNNSKFVNCDMTRIVAEEASFKNSSFSNCEMVRGIYTHSNFTNSTVLNCNGQSSSFVNCCMEHFENLSAEWGHTDMTGVSFNEQDWSQDDESPALSM